MLIGRSPGVAKEKRETARARTKSEVKVYRGPNDKPWGFWKEVEAMILELFQSTAYMRIAQCRVDSRRREHEEMLNVLQHIVPRVHAN